MTITITSKYLSDDYQTRETRTYWVSDTARSGYVHDVTDKPGTLGPQVCEGLYSTGSTLMANTDTLASVIRRELARRRRMVERETARVFSGGR